MEIDNVEEPSRCYIHPDYTSEMIHTRNELTTAWKQVDHLICRIIRIKECPSTRDGCVFIRRAAFANTFSQLSHAFVVVIECNDLRELSEQEIANLSYKYSNKNTMIIAFECNQKTIMYYKDDNRFRLVGSPYEENESGNFSFEVLIKQLNNNSGGFFRSFNSQAHIIPTHRHNDKRWIDCAAESSDFHAIKFLYLFNNDIRPSYNASINILNNDIWSKSLEGFETIFDLNFKIYDPINIAFSEDDWKMVYHCIPNESNFLMTAVECGNVNACWFFIQMKVDVNYSNSEGINSAQLAYKNSQYKILAMLLKANSPYPLGFDQNWLPMPYELREFIDDTGKLHNIIKDSKNRKFDEIEIQTITNIIAKYPRVCHFYNSANVSATTIAIEHRNFNAYELLLRNGIHFGIREDYNTIVEPLDMIDKDTMRVINSSLAKSLWENHLLILYSNSRCAHHTQEGSEHFEEYIKEAFEILNEMPSIRPILEVVAAHRMFQIIFDFSSLYVERIDPTQPEGVFAIYYPTNQHIYIGAKNLCRNETKFETIAGLIHELTHFAMLIVFDNEAKPYKPSTFDETSFNMIVNTCKVFKDKDRIVQMVYNYDENKWHAELIVRVPQMAVAHHNNEVALNECKSTFSPLFQFYDNILDTIQDAIPTVQGKFFKLDAFRNAELTKKIRKEKFIRLFLSFLVICLAIALFVLIHVIFKYESCLNDANAICRWKDLNSETKEGVLNTLVKFNSRNQRVKFRDIVDDNLKALNALPSDLIKNPEKININDFLSPPEQPHFNRYFVTEGRTIMYNPVLNLCEIPPSYIINLAEVREIASQNRKITLIADDPLTGKTELFKNISIELSNTNELFWISMVDFSKVNQSIVDKSVNFTRESIFNFINCSSVFEKEILMEKFISGRGILFIDGATSMHSKLIEDLIKTFEIELWISTRSPHNKTITKAVENAIGQKFKSIFQLFPLDDRNRTAFFKSQLETMLPDHNATQIKNQIENVEKVITAFHTWRSYDYYYISNIYILKIIIDNTVFYSNGHAELKVFNAFKNYTEKILDNKVKTDAYKKLKIVALSKIDCGRNRVNASISDLLFYLDSTPLTIPNGILNTNELTELKDIGIIKFKGENVEFIHETLKEFFIAKYVIEDVYEEWIKNFHDDFKGIQQLRFILDIGDDKRNIFKVVGLFIIDAIKVENSNFFKDIWTNLANSPTFINKNQKFSSTLEQEYQNFNKSTNKTTLKPFLKDFFSILNNPDINAVIQ